MIETALFAIICALGGIWIVLSDIRDILKKHKEEEE